MTSNQAVRWVLKPAVFLAALIPFGLLLRGLLTDNLGADPLKEITPVIVPNTFIPSFAEHETREPQSPRNPDPTGPSSEGPLPARALS